MGRGRSLVAIGTLAVAGLAGARAARRFILSRPVPPRSERLSCPGLIGSVDISIDCYGVPHVRAGHASDVFFAQGYLHARDRFFQMDLNRRVAAGTLSELFGEATIDADRFFRRLRFSRQALSDLGAQSEEGRAALSAYAAGVNAYRARHRRPLEYTLLRVAPAPWTTQDSLAFGRYMAWSQTTNWESELVRGQLLAALGPQRFAAIDLGDPASMVPAVHVRAQPAAEAARGLPVLAGLRGGGSNNWAVSPQRSASGHPLLANDPHLYPRIPAVWYVAHLRGDGYNVTGATLPGLPGVLIGHNQRIAWGVTAGMVDCEDLYVERETPQVEVATILVRGTDPVQEKVLSTGHGPVLNGLLGIPERGPLLAVRSVLNDWPQNFDALFAINRARDWSEFRAALRNWTFPALNFVYADVEGNIGYQLSGRVPIRARGDGFAPVPGWTGTHEWTGTIPFDEMPSAFNPPDGVLATANTRPDVPTRHFLGRDWCDDNRWRRIVTQLRARPVHTLDDFAELQRDVLSMAARDALFFIRPAIPDGEGPLASLRSWDGSLSMDSVPATLYAAFRRAFMRDLLSGLPGEDVDQLLGRGLDERLAPTTTFFYRGSSIFLAHLERADRRLIRRALEAAVKDVRRSLGRDPSGWQWGRAHRVRFRHPIGAGAPAVDRLLGLSRGPLPMGGDADTPLQAAVHPWAPFTDTAYMPSYRQLFDLADWDAARFILPTGQSGHPGSRHYDDMLGAWHAGGYLPLVFTDAAVDAASAERITLLPGPP